MSANEKLYIVENNNGEYIGMELTASDIAIANAEGGNPLPYYSQAYLDRAVEAVKQEALDIISQYAGIDEAHHKQWVIDQVVRALTGDDYEAWVREWEQEVEDENVYVEWDEGIAP